MKTVKAWSNEDPDDFLHKRDMCRNRLNSVTLKEGPSDHQYEDVIRQCLPPGYDIIRQIYSERENCNLADIRRITSKIYTDNLSRSNSDSSRDITGRGAAMQATKRDLKCHFCNNSGHYKNCTDFKAVRQQDQQRRQRQHKQRGRYQPHQSKPRGSSSRGEGTKCGAHITRPPPTVTPITVPGRQTGPTATPTSPKSVFRVFLESTARGMFLSNNNSNEKPCISFSEREVQSATKPAEV